MVDGCRLRPGEILFTFRRPFGECGGVGNGDLVPFPGRRDGGELYRPSREGPFSGAVLRRTPSDGNLAVSTLSRFWSSCNRRRAPDSALDSSTLGNLSVVFKGPLFALENSGLLLFR